jgi:hypothetical protein
MAAAHDKPNKVVPATDKQTRFNFMTFPFLNVKKPHPTSIDSTQNPTQNSIHQRITSQTYSPHQRIDSPQITFINYLPSPQSAIDCKLHFK